MSATNNCNCWGFFRSSIGRKKLMGLSGLGLCGFILTHMAANMLILFSAESYNAYSHALISNPLIEVIELGLVAVFIAHIILGIKLTLENRKAKGSRYAVTPKSDVAASAAAKSIILSGLVILVFLVLHLKTFKFGPWYETIQNGVEMRDLYRLVIEVFQSPGYVIWYILSVGLLFAHLSHAFAASFQSLGIGNVHQRSLKKAGYAFAALVCGGFISQPIYVFFFLPGGLS